MLGVTEDIGQGPFNCLDKQLRGCGGVSRLWTASLKVFWRITNSAFHHLAISSRRVHSTSNAFARRMSSVTLAFSTEVSKGLVECFNMEEWLSSAITYLSFSWHV